MESHFLQSSSWEKFLQSEGKTTFRLTGTHFSALCSLEHTPFGNYLYCPYGPALENKSALKPALKALRSLAKDVSATFIRIEPTLAFSAKEMAKYGLKKSHDQNPAHTWIVDLRGEPSDILKKLPKRTRGYYNTYEKKGISISVSHDPADIKKLIRLQQPLAQRKHISTFSDDYLRAELSQPFASLYTAELDHKCIAAILTFENATTGFYMQAASDPAYKKFAANSILATQILLDMQQSGKTTFDFWGIAPDNAKPSHPWYGFTAFKKSFEGTPVSYSGTWDLPLNRPKYALYGIFRRMNLILRKLRA